MAPRDSSQDIRDRSFRFACDVASIAPGLSTRHGVRCMVDQLLKAGTSVGANLDEAKAGSSKRDFIRSVEIGPKESRETVYWLRICLSLDLGDRAEITAVLNEGEQITRILGAIVRNAKWHAPGSLLHFAC